MTDLKEYGYDPALYGLPAEGELPARVLSVQKERCGLISPLGEGYARLKASAFYGSARAIFPTVGDFVSLRPNESGDSVITRVLPRKSFFARADSFSARGMQAVAANIDIALLVSSLNRDFNVRRLERYLAQTIESGARPVFVLTKADLCPDPSAYVEQVRALCPGAPVYAISAHTGAGMDQISAMLLPGVTLALLGMSGVGKSSLLNALMGFERMKVNRVRDVDSAKGRHTTTHRELVRLPGGALLIDTPGMRELGVWDAQEGAAEVFSDIEAIAAQCRFSDCRHEREPGCAVQAALESGLIDKKRYRSYLDIMQQAQRTARLAARRRR